ncbi:MAG: DUF4159 domain-containing protein [Steroidobacteraceae bacterium]
MRLRLRQISQQLGLALAMALYTLLSGAVPGSVPPTILTTPPPPEFRLARLAYNDGAALGGGFGRFRNSSWTTDAPEAEFHLTQGIRRLTRIDTINPDELGDMSDVVLPVQPLDADLSTYPFLYAVEVGRWYLNDAEAAAMRDYLLRGGFLMVDDFHGSLQWEGFMESMRRIFPDREVVEIPDDHEVFHVLYDLDHKVQIPGVYALMSGRTYEQDGVDPHWRGVFDDTGRLMVAINFNMDLGDAWEHADTPEYPQPLTALAYRFAISYALYAMTH